MNQGDFSVKLQFQDKWLKRISEKNPGTGPNLDRKPNKGKKGRALGWPHHGPRPGLAEEASGAGPCAAQGSGWAGGEESDPRGSQRERARSLSPRSRLTAAAQRGSGEGDARGNNGTRGRRCRERADPSEGSRIRWRRAQEVTGVDVWASGSGGHGRSCSARERDEKERQREGHEAAKGGPAWGRGHRRMVR